MQRNTSTDGKLPSWAPTTLFISNLTDNLQYGFQ